jgi:hypothetical protein
MVSEFAHLGTRNLNEIHFNKIKRRISAGIYSVHNVSYCIHFET